MSFTLISDSSDTIVLRIAKVNLFGLFPETVVREMTKTCLNYEGHVKERAFERLAI